MTIEFTIETGDITTFDADVVVLKYAQKFYGVDRIIAGMLNEAGEPVESLRAQAGDYSFVETRGCIEARTVLYVGVPPLHQFSYPQIREFAANALSSLAR